jgi:hypothetical protein
LDSHARVRVRACVVNQPACFRLGDAIFRFVEIDTDEPTIPTVNVYLRDRINAELLHHGRSRINALKQNAVDLDAVRLAEI